VNSRNGAWLSDQARRELHTESAIALDVIAERGYESITRPTNGDARQRERLKTLQIPSWAIREDSYFPGLLIPIFGPTGARVSYQWKPRRPVPNRDGKAMKYASPRGQVSRLDVHPRNRDKIADPTVELWITEGVKKADSLTSRGVVAVALTGVFNWRSTHGTLGDWEDVALRGRSVTVAFDSDARTNPNVLRAMIRLGRWLKSKGVAKVWYLITPSEVDGKPTKGVDDYFRHGGSLSELKAGRTIKPPNPDIADDAFSDSRLAEVVADEVLADHFIWAPGLGWLSWDGQLWVETTEAEPTEALREYALERFAQAVQDMRAGTGSKELVDGWRSMLSFGRMRSVLSLTRGIKTVGRKAQDLDADPRLLNTPSGVCDLESGELSAHDSALLMTKITSGSYRPGFTHPDWTTALEALPEPEREWLQARIGQAITGHPTPDGVMPICAGAGENGKSALTTDGLVPALGGYASMASTKLFQASKGTEHSTERAELRGKRLLIAEELTEGRSIDVTALKQIQDVTMITARRIRRDNVTFSASHSLFTTTNYTPIVAETDHGTWRRLALLRFPYTFRKPGEPLDDKGDRQGDPGLKERIRGNADHQHDAIVTWAIEGAVRYHSDRSSIALTETIKADTREWRIEADRILGFWDAWLIADLNACVMTRELHELFNEWLSANGHTKWSAETFAPRFEQHAETIKRRVTKAQVRDLSRLVRRRHSWGPGDPPKRPHVYLGVRWRRDNEEGSEGSDEPGS
jgi:P4 family phage/plasmid primase-like protien